MAALGVTGILIGIGLGFLAVGFVVDKVMSWY